ncbi:MAG: hypothetical protein LBK58_01075 [Prevotellaceae bacterium]|jgi:hypothetical protein|nr:hypothetical protein [Prevotellaceae bacterium]
MKTSGYDGEIDLVKAEVYSENDETTLASVSYTNGGFTLKLPESVSDKYLDNFVKDYLGDDYEGITVSNPNVKVCEVNLEAYESGSDNRIGSFYHKTEDWEGDLYYVEADLSITGSSTDEYGDTSKFSNFHLKKGWNIIYFKHIGYIYEWTTQVPEGAKWHFYYSK